MHSAPTPTASGTWLARVQRWARHLRASPGHTRRLLGDAAFARIEARVAQFEQNTRSELRVVIESGLSHHDLWHGCSPRQRAVSLFSALRVWDTQANNGLLIYVLLADRAIEILADRGLAERLPAGTFEQVIGAMRPAFQRGAYESGILGAIDQIAQAWANDPATTPTSAPRSDELPNAPTVL